jgi:hypothetical protein
MHSPHAEIIVTKRLGDDLWAAWHGSESVARLDPAESGGPGQRAVDGGRASADGGGSHPAQRDAAAARRPEQPGSGGLADQVSTTSCRSSGVGCEGSRADRGEEIERGLACESSRRRAPSASWRRSSKELSQQPLGPAVVDSVEDVPAPRRAAEGQQGARSPDPVQDAGRARRDAGEDQGSAEAALGRRGSPPGSRREVARGAGGDRQSTGGAGQGAGGAEALVQRLGDDLPRGVQSKAADLARAHHSEAP